MKHAAKEKGRRLLAPLARLFANLGISPDHLTWAGAAASGIAGVLVGAGWFRTAALLLLVGALCDVLDGSVARATGKSSVFGAFLDSTVDRIAELLFFAGVLVYFIRVDDSALYPLLTLLAAGGSFLVSYTRARAEGLGVSCAVGMMERPERLILLLVATLVGPIGVRVAMAVLTPLVFWTSFQRMHHVYRETRV